MASRIVHVYIDVRGALRNFSPRDWRNCCTDTETGQTLTPEEVRDCLMDELAKGHKVIPMGKACDGFDYSGGGCPGHPQPDEETEGKE